MKKQLFLFALLATTVFRAEAQVSTLYAYYADRSDVTVAYIANYPLDSVHTTAVTVLYPGDSAAWEGLVDTILSVHPSRPVGSATPYRYTSFATGSMSLPHRLPPGTVVPSSGNDCFVIADHDRRILYVFHTYSKEYLKLIISLTINKIHQQ